MLAPVTHILPLTNIRRMRTLPIPGRVLVHPGQKVNATDVIAQARVPSGHMVLDIRRGLGIPQASAAERCVVRQQGDHLEKGDVIAESGGMFARIIRAPVEGEIVSIYGGQVLLRVRNTITDVKAGFTGTVSDLVEDRGAIVETNGALVQGAWGNGKIDTGMLLVLAKDPAEELVNTQIEVSMRGAVVLAGHCAKADALRAGNDMQLRGLILSSLSSGLIPVAQGVNYPVLVMEGFGRIPMNEAAFKLLSTNEKRDVSICAILNPATGNRPELVIPLLAAGETAPETDSFAYGQTVRIVGAPYTGKLGTIVQVRQGLVSLPNGLKAPAADVQIEQDTRVTVPLANLEVIK